MSDIPWVHKIAELNDTVKELKAKMYDMMTYTEGVRKQHEAMLTQKRTLRDDVLKLSIEITILKNEIEKWEGWGKMQVDKHIIAAKIAKHMGIGEKE